MQHYTCQSKTIHCKSEPGPPYDTTDTYMYEITDQSWFSLDSPSPCLALYWTTFRRSSMDQWGPQEQLQNSPDQILETKETPSDFKTVNRTQLVPVCMRENTEESVAMSL